MWCQLVVLAAHPVLRSVLVWVGGAIHSPQRRPCMMTSNPERLALHLYHALRFIANGVLEEHLMELIGSRILTRRLAVHIWMQRLHYLQVSLPGRAMVDVTRLFRAESGGVSDIAVACSPLHPVCVSDVQPGCQRWWSGFRLDIHYFTYFNVHFGFLFQFWRG